MVIPQSKQLELKGLLNRRVGEYWVYHDEIKAQRGKLPVTGHGTLVVPREQRAAMYWALQAARGNFDGRIHYRKISGRRGPLFDAAQGVVQTFFTQFIRNASFKATFALHDGPRPLAYPGDDEYQRHAVNSTSSNIVGHVRYVLREFDLLLLRPVFDGTDNARERHYFQWGVESASHKLNRPGKVGGSNL